MYIALIIVILVAVMLYIKPTAKKPPSPRGVPLLGVVPYINFKNPGKSFLEWSKKHGPVISVRFLREEIIILSDFDIVKQCLTASGHDYSGRLIPTVLADTQFQPGILFADYGESWKQHRKFMHHTLRVLGMVNSSIDSSIYTELESLNEQIVKHNGSPFDIEGLLARTLGNVLFKIIAGTKLCTEEHKSMITGWKDTTKKSSKNGVYLTTMAFAYFARHLPGVKQFHQHIVKASKEARDEAEKIIKDHETTLDRSHLRDFVDHYLVKIEDPEVDNDIFNRDQLIQLIVDLNKAGTDTSASTIRWCLLAAAKYPHYQEKVYKEIQDVVGSCFPKLTHEKMMPFTRAFILEIFRVSAMFPYVERNSTTDVSIGDFNFKKNTRFFVNVWAIHYDSDSWESPNEFNPLRFINKNGEFVKSEKVIPFMLGPRHCLGKNLAEKEIFIFLCGILQKFKINGVGELPHICDGKYGVTRKPMNFKIACQER